ncbi:MAG: polyprenyl synthetase family protein [Pseudomonadota bacterium]
MDPTAIINASLEQVLANASDECCPPRFLEALNYAVMPGGARVRPKLTLAVAKACDADDPATVASAACAVEMIHCASLVHDDLPCFDDAATRRGKPSVHVAYGQRLAVLAGDALIVMAFETLARGAADHPERLPALVGVLASSVGAPCGIAAGQAWECEPEAPLGRYQRQKTGSLFVAATALGAAAAGVEAKPWEMLGRRMGEAYQVADDILDVTADPEEIGKPIGRDSDLHRPNSVLERGMSASEERLKRLVTEAMDSIPTCPGEEKLRGLIEVEARAFIDHALMRSAAA